MSNTNGDSLFTRFNGNPPARRDDVERVQQQLNFPLPKSYVDFMLTRNGGEGFIGNSYLALWKVEELISLNNAYHVAEFAPGLFLFGSNGGDEAFGFYARSESQRVVSIPFVGMQTDDAKVMAPDFDSFLLALVTS